MECGDENEPAAQPPVDGIARGEAMTDSAFILAVSVSITPKSSDVMDWPFLASRKAASAAEDADVVRVEVLVMFRMVLNLDGGVD
jgi:hypothetical protein